MKTTNKLWLGLIVLIALSPLGLFLPEHFKAGSAWGEWRIDTKLANLWKAPMSDYAFKGWEEKGLGHLSLAYVASAVLGIAIIVALTLFIGRILANKHKD
jgi:cobalt/nickel transport protein